MKSNSPVDCWAPDSSGATIWFYERTSSESVPGRQKKPSNRMAFFAPGKGAEQ